MTECAVEGPIWACPQCGGPFNRSHRRYICDACGRVWPVVDGIPHFVSDAPYWGEIPEPTLSWVLEEMKTRHWKEVLSAVDEPDLAPQIHVHPESQSSQLAVPTAGGVRQNAGRSLHRR